MSLLIVEDNALNSKILDLNLRKHGFETIITETGKEALECLKNTLGIQLVIADIMMPEMDGLELLEHMKNDPVLNNIPVIMCTSVKNIDFVKKAVEIGCHHYFVKPINAGQLIKKIHEILGPTNPILKNRNRIMLETNMDDDTYDEIINQLLDLVQKAIHKIEDKRIGKDRKDLLTWWNELLGGVTLIGAKRVENILKRVLPENSTQSFQLNDYDRLLLLRELKELRLSLQSIPNPMFSND